MRPIMIRDKHYLCNLMDKSLLDKALNLEDSEKLALIDELYDSLDRPDPEIEDAWLKEAIARREAHLRGKAKLVPMEEVFGKYQ